jgi:hypothetical protein
MRVMKWVVLACLVGSQPACEQVEGWRASRGDDGPTLALSLEAPETLDWGGTGTIRVGLENRGRSERDGATVQVRLPPWLEFGPVEPSGTEVVFISDSDGTRLSYRLMAPLGSGERREIVQHVRVPAAATEPGTGQAPRPATTAPPVDTAGEDVAGAAVRPPPEDRVVRARLLRADGGEMGAEVQAVLAFRGADPGAPGSAVGGRGDVVRDEGVGGVRLGMTAEELRREIPGARDTTLALPDGGQERAVLVPIAGGRSIAAIVSARGVEQIVVRDTGFSTEQGLGVGSRLGDLRNVYGRECAEPFGRNRVAVSFAAEPGVAFALSATAPADTARLRQDPSPLPDSARVTEIWVRERRPDC